MINELISTQPLFPMEQKEKHIYFPLILYIIYKSRREEKRREEKRIEREKPAKLGTYIRGYISQKGEMSYIRGYISSYIRGYISLKFTILYFLWKIKNGLWKIHKLR